MNKSETPKIGTTEKVTRFVCGSLLGVFVGLYCIAKWKIMSSGTAVGTWVLAILVCGYLAVKYGDEFRYGIFGRNK